MGLVIFHYGASVMTSGLKKKKTKKTPDLICHQHNVIFQEDIMKTSVIYNLKV